MTSDPATGLTDDELRPLVEAEQARLSVEQVHPLRLALPHFLLDVCIAWCVWRAGLGMLAWVWLAIMTLCQVGRSVYVVYLDKQGRLPPAQMLRRVSMLLVGLGALHVPAVVMVFSRPIMDSHYILTMIMVGNAAGAVSPAAGNVRAYLQWAVVFGGALTVAWWSQGTLQGFAIGVLVIFLFIVLTMYVRDQGRMQAKQVRLSESLRRERDRAERASEAKTRFFAAASHDLRQPLTALAYNAATVEFLAQRDGDEILASVGDGINLALAESRSLLESLFEVSELDAGAVDVEMRDADVRTLMIQVRDMFEPAARERGLEFRFKADPRVPVIARTDLAQLRRIVHNLVGNAIKFTNSGWVEIEVVARSGLDAGPVLLRVTDTGPGIPVEAQERVFEEFFQIGNPERNRSRGLGLGLAIVQRIAVLIDARITLRSEPAKGSVFEVALPRGSGLAPPVSVDPTPAARFRMPMPSRRILLLDDEAEIRKSLSTLMVEMGWVVRAVATHDEALRSWDAGFAPDALLLDFRLREGTSGLDTLTALRERGCEATAILITGDTAPQRIAAARAAGVPVMYKPVDGFKLISALDSAIEAARGRSPASM